MTTIQELLAQREELEKKIEALKAAETEVNPARMFVPVPEIDGLKARIAELEKAEWYYDEDGEYSGIDPTDIADKMDLGVGGILMVYGARDVYIKYVAHLAISYDDDGDPDDSEYEVFSSKEDAQQAVAAMPKPPEGK